LQNLEAKKTYKKERPITDKEGLGARTGKGQKTGVKPGQKPQAKTGRPAPREIAKPLEPRTITIPSVLTLKELAEKMAVSGAELVKSLIKKGQMIGINNEIPYTMAADIALNYNVIAEEEVEVDIFEDVFGEAPDAEDSLVTRPPVVVVMGHVDHGKTSLLDAIRNTSVTKAEQGGITQHIGAYTTYRNERPITFLDTPGHEAFTAMRMRGAQVTDIAVLVVAADDGVMPQTIEAISHAKAAGVDIIVAINKMDKPSANPERVKQELTEYGLVAEEWGGETICVPVSAIKHEGIDSLLEMIILVADMKDLRANPDKRARGVIIEAKREKGRGSVATVLVQEGSLKIGDPIVAGITHGRIRAMNDDKGKSVKKAGPATPVEILGLPEVPNAGDMFYVAASEKQARMVAETYYAKGRHEMTKAQTQKVSLDDLFNQIQAGKVKELNVIIKADVQGSVEAVRQSLEKLSNDEVRIKTILGNVGAITESDVSLASASNAIIIGFNVRPEQSAKSVAEEQEVDIRLYRIIYNAIEDIQAAMKGMLDPIYEEKVLGRAEIRQLFKASGIGTIGGSYVLDGKLTRNAQTRIVRDGIIVYDGTFDSIKRFKDDVREVLAGYECGLVFERFNDIKQGDIVEAYVMEEIKR
jgi:translation initiation factor IF-2